MCGFHVHFSKRFFGFHDKMHDGRSLGTPVSWAMELAHGCYLYVCRLRRSRFGWSHMLETQQTFATKIRMIMENEKVVAKYC
jgi:hypothetical protein